MSIPVSRIFSHWAQDRAKQFSAVALASYPISRGRFILMSLLPAVLGVVPLILFLISPETNKALNGVLFGLMIMGLISPIPTISMFIRY